MYYTIEDHYKQNAERHLERAIAYASAGYPDRYYEASMKKALKNFKIANEFKLPEFMNEAALKLSKIVADAIMYGISYYTTKNGEIKEHIGLQDIIKGKR